MSLAPAVDRTQVKTDGHLPSKRLTELEVGDELRLPDGTWITATAVRLSMAGYADVRSGDGLACRWHILYGPDVVVRTPASDRTTDDPKPEPDRTPRAPHCTTIRTSRSGLSHRVRCTDCKTTGPWRTCYEEAWDDATRHELLTTAPGDRSFDDSEMLELLGRCDLLDPGRERRERPTIETTPGLNEDQRMALWEYRRAETLYEDTPLDEFPSGPGQKGTVRHSRRVNRLSKANKVMLDLGIGHLR